MKLFVCVSHLKQSVMCGIIHIVIVQYGLIYIVLVHRDNVLVYRVDRLGNNVGVW